MFTKTEFTRLAEMNKDAVFRLAYSLLKNPADADDAAQNALLRLYQSNKHFESDEHVRNWLMRVTVNECRMLWRSSKHRAESIDDYADTLAFEDKYYGDLQPADYVRSSNDILNPYTPDLYERCKKY